MVDAAFAFNLDTKKKMALSQKELEKQKAKGVADLIDYLEKNGGSIRYSGPISRYLKNQLNTPLIKTNTGANILVRLAREQGKIEIEADGTQFVLRLCG